MTMPSLERKNQPVVAPSDKMDDHSSTFHTLRAKLIDDKGRRYLDLVRALRPNYARVCRDIALGYGMLTASCFLTVWLPFQGAASMLTIVVGSRFSLATGSLIFNSSFMKARISISLRIEPQTSVSAMD